MINILDFETYKQDNMVLPYCISFSFKDEINSFYLDCVSDKKDNYSIFLLFLNYVVNNLSDPKVEFYIHNLDFDGFLIISSLTKFLINFKLYSEKKKLFMIKVDYCSKIIYFKCSYKIIPMSLSKLGEIENIPKKFFPYKFVTFNTINYVGSIPNASFWEKDDYLKFLVDKDEFYVYNLKKETIAYCENDVVLTKKVLKNLFNIVDEESILIRKKSLSASSMSYHIFLKKYNDLNVPFNLKLDHDSYIRNSYFGGRCEVFGNILNNEHIKYFDFSGMYAQCMLENFHTGIGKFEIPTSFEKPGFYNIDFFSDLDNIPFLPNHFKSKLMFCNGVQNGTFWYEEILFFVSLGGIVIKINNALLYESCGLVFEKFINKFSEIRKKDGYYNIFGKLMINSLYGSMGLNKKDVIQHITFSEEEFINLVNNTNVVDFYKINECFILLIKEDYKSSHFFFGKDNFSDFSLRNVSYAAAITSKARIKLYKAFIDVLKDNGRILYCDTDSIFAGYDKKDVRQFTDSKEIKWLNFYSDGVFAAPKTYALFDNKKETIKIKGVDVKEVNFNSFKKVFYNNSALIFKNQLNFRKSEYFLKQYYIEKKISLCDYDKRIFSKDKKNTFPIYI